MQVETIKVQCQICGKCFDAPKHRAHLMKYCPESTRRNCRAKAAKQAQRRWQKQHPDWRKKRPTPYIKGLNLKSNKSERHCLLCGIDPSPNYFYCEECHRYKLKNMQQRIDGFYVYLDGQKHGECFC